MYSSCMNKSAFILTVIAIFILFFVHDTLDPTILKNITTNVLRNNIYEIMYFPNNISIEYKYISEIKTGDENYLDTKSQIINYDRDEGYMYFQNFENENEDCCYIYSKENWLYIATINNDVKKYSSIEFDYPSSAKLSALGVIKELGFNQIIETYFRGVDQLETIIDCCDKLIDFNSEEYKENYNVITHHMDLSGYVDENNINSIFSQYFEEDNIFFKTSFDHNIETMFSNGYLIYYFNESKQIDSHIINNQTVNNTIHKKTEISIDYDEFELIFPDLTDGFVLA